MTVACERVPDSRRPFARYARELPNYWDRDAVPSVGAILAHRFGPVPDFDYIKKAAHRGKLVHLCCELFDIGDLDEDSIAGTDLAGYLDGWRRWCGGQPGEWAQVELPLWATVDGVTYCGVVDRIGYVRGICEIKSKSKSGRAPKRDSDEWLRHGLQLAAYSELVAATPEGRIDRRQCVYLFPNGHVEVEDYSRDNEMFDEEWRNLLRDWKEQKNAEADPSTE